MPPIRALPYRFVGSAKRPDPDKNSASVKTPGSHGRVTAASTARTIDKQEQVARFQNRRFELVLRPTLRCADHPKIFTGRSRRRPTSPTQLDLTLA